jgi:hypothetical protein
MAVDWPCGERERLANDFPIHDGRRLLADHQSTCYTLSLELKLEHELLSRHRGAFPSAIPHIAGVLAGERRAGKARCVPQERHIDAHRDRVTRRATDRNRNNRTSSFHHDISQFLKLRRVPRAEPLSTAGRSLRTWRHGIA